MGLCDTSEVSISRSMPAVMEGRLNDFAWKSFCDKMDDALKPIAEAKKIMAFGIGGTMMISLIFIIVGFVTFGALASKSVSSFGESTTSPMVGFGLFGAGMVLMIVGIVASSFYASSKSGEARNKMKKVCEETSAMHPGISFHIRDEMRFMGYNNRYGNNGYNNGYGNGYNSNVQVSNTNYIEVYVTEGTAGEANITQGYYAPSSVPSAPVMAVAEVDIVVKPSAPVMAVAEVGCGVKNPEERMRELGKMKDILTEDEYQAKRAEILSDV